ncbi:MAG TPA: hypothetical protein VIF62_04005 [Labilithrix sp.]
MTAIRSLTRWVSLVAAIGACAGPKAPESRPRVVWDYVVRIGPEGDLDAEGTFVGARGELHVDDDAAPFLSGLVRDGDHARWHVRLRELAKTKADVDTAIALGGAIFAPPSSWLVRPSDVPEGRYRFRVEPADRFVTGVRANGDAYEADADTLDEATFAAFGKMRVRRVAEPAFDAAIAPEVALSDEVVAKWLGREIDAIARWLGRPPDGRATIFFAPGTQDVTRGKTIGAGGASVLVRIGTKVTAENVLDDWVVAHELIHVGFPNVEPENTWFAEGLATYAEPIARVRAGLIGREKFWGDLVDGLPRGVPKGKPLVGESDFGRVYWGGALYFLLADLGVREQTNGKRSLDDAIRAVVATGANGETTWTLARVLDTCDAATGTTLFHDLHRELALAPGGRDVPALFRRLGVSKNGFDDTAPLAKLRDAITAP